MLSVNPKKVLTKLPPDNIPLYGRIVEQVLCCENEELVECARSILRAMVVAYRPLTFDELGIVPTFLRSVDTTRRSSANT